MIPLILQTSKWPPLRTIGKEHTTMIVKAPISATPDRLAMP